MKEPIVLKGITWDHSRGYCPKVATAQRFSELHPHIKIEWSKRSLQGFADEHIDVLAQQYDLLIIDHPWAGYAADTGIIIPFNKYLPEAFIQDQQQQSVGKSCESYNFGGDLYALPVDTATPVASSRPDLLEKAGEKVPETWEDLLRLAKKGLVTMPGIPIDTLMNFYMFCNVLGEEPFKTDDYVVNNAVGIEALKMMKRLTDLLNPEFFNWNPIKVYEALTSRNDYAYCPWAYGYTNYARDGYASKKLQFHDIIKNNEGKDFQSTLGGAGLAISASSKHIDAAVAYAEFIASPETQKRLYFDNGGQPGHRSAWLDAHTNALSSQFFQSTLKTHDNAFLRPRYNGYLHFQDNAGDYVRNYLMSGGDEVNVLNHMNALYVESKTKVSS